MQIACMIVGLLMVSAAAMWGLNGLHQDYGLAWRAIRNCVKSTAKSDRIWSRARAAEYFRRGSSRSGHAG